MTQLDEIKHLIGRVDERTARMSEQLDDLERAVFRGNGRPSVLARLDVLESGEARRTQESLSGVTLSSGYWRAVGGIVVAVVVAVAGLLGVRATQSTLTARDTHTGP